MRFLNELRLGLEQPMIVLCVIWPPYVCVVHQAELIMLGLGLKSGLVVSSGHLCTFIVPVWQGTVLEHKNQFFKVAG